MPYERLDYDLIARWCVQRKITPWTRKEVPSLGRVVLYQRKIAAVGFLRSMEGMMCMLDGLIADPSLNQEIRDQALNSLVEDLLLQARWNEHRVIAFTDLNCILKRAEKFGFEKKTTTMLTWEYRGD